MNFDNELKRLLALELCAVMDGWKQINAAAMLDISQPAMSRLRRGILAHYSAGRLMRLIASRGHHVKISFTEEPRKYAKPKCWPTITVERIDRYGRVVAPASTQST